MFHLSLPESQRINRIDPLPRSTALDRKISGRCPFICKGGPDSFRITSFEEGESKFIPPVQTG